MRPKHPYKRRQYLVDPAYQLRFVTRVFMAVMGVVVVSSILSSVLLTVNMYRVELGLHAMLIGCLIAVAVTLLIELLLAIPIVYIFGVRSSHRIVGPMKRIKQTLEAIGKGDFSQRITLRQGDALEDLARSINQMAINLQQHSARSSGS